MRRASLIFLLIVLIATTTLILNCSRPTPTPFNWQAHVSTLAGDGSPKGLSDPFGIAIGRDGAIYLADTGNNRIRKITPEGVVSTVAGTGTAGYLDGPANVAQFDGPIGVGVDAKGNIYVADTYNDRIRKISLE